MKQIAIVFNNINVIIITVGVSILKVSKIYELINIIETPNDTHITDMIELYELIYLNATFTAIRKTVNKLQNKNKKYK